MPDNAAPVNDITEEPEARGRRRWRLIRSGLFAGLAIYLGNGCATCFLNAGSVDVSRPIVYVDRGGGVTVSRDGGRTREEYAGLTRDGKVAYPARYALRRNEIVFWSPEDRSLCILPRVGKPRWLSLKGSLSESDTVQEVLTSPEGVVLNLMWNPSELSESPGEAERYRGTLRVNLATSKAERIPDVLEARTRETSDVFAVRTAAERIESRSSDNSLRAVLVSDAKQIMDWDYDPERGRLAYISSVPFDHRSGWRIHYVQGATQRWSKPTGLFYTANLVTLPPNSNDIWVSEISAYPGAVGLAVLSERGRLRGWRVKSTFGVGRRPIVELDEEGLALVRRLPRWQEGY